MRSLINSPHTQQRLHTPLQIDGTGVSALRSLSAIVDGMKRTLGPVVQEEENGLKLAVPHAVTSLDAANTFAAEEGKSPRAQEKGNTCVHTEKAPCKSTCLAAKPSKNYVEDMALEELIGASGCEDDSEGYIKRNATMRMGYGFTCVCFVPQAALLRVRYQLAWYVHLTTDGTLIG
jgi:hypothetical protein